VLGGNAYRTNSYSGNTVGSGYIATTYNSATASTSYKCVYCACQILIIYSPSTTTTTASTTTKKKGSLIGTIVGIVVGVGVFLLGLLKAGLQYLKQKNAVGDMNLPNSSFPSVTSFRFSSPFKVEPQFPQPQFPQSQFPQQLPQSAPIEMTPFLQSQYPQQMHSSQQPYPTPIHQHQHDQNHYQQPHYQNPHHDSHQHPPSYAVHPIPMNSTQSQQPPYHPPDSSYPVMGMPAVQVDTVEEVRSPSGYY